MQIKSSVFVKSATKPSQYPEANIAEIAFAGKSNVGKSSLINAIVNKKRLVKTSSTPGRTQLINFFLINEKMHFVDLPGYGYAKVPVNIRKKWGPMIETYLSERNSLKGVVFILDIRRTPGQEEKSIINWFKFYNIDFISVLTKADKLKKSKQIAQHQLIAKELLMDPKDFILFSAKTRLGKDNILKAISQLTAK